MVHEKKTEQRLLVGQGTVEQHEVAFKMLEALADLMTKPRPIIGHTDWADSITPEQRGRIQLERMKQIKEANGEKIDMATDYEAMVYLSTASLSAPLSRVFERIYCHLFKRFYPDKSDFIPDHEATLDIQAEQELRDLKRWLYNQSKKHAKPMAILMKART